MRLTALVFVHRGEVPNNSLWTRWVGLVTVHSAPFVLINLRSLVRQCIGRGLGRRDRW